MEKEFIYLQQDLGKGIMKYMRVIRTGNKVEYDECMMQGKKVLDFNEKLTDSVYLDKILAAPQTKGCSPIVFHGKTGIPM
ncbi:hypothetical protein ACEN9X_13330 [Mucilaginibacter sp. Mucisp86]|uniref:hypothetical protein n=1 Tax=Mucilaginibacter sp. Mucisp86 TaxID=3243060 RepID=UPI0039B3C7F5